MIDPDKHPEQDPAEGSRGTIERDLQLQNEPYDGDKKKGASKNPGGTPCPGSEADEPTPA